MRKEKKQMAIPQNLINVIANLPIGSKVTITVDSCAQWGIPVSPQQIKVWGRDVSRNFANYGLAEDNSINPGCGKLSSKSTNNLKHYIKVI